MQRTIRALVLSIAVIALMYSSSHLFAAAHDEAKAARNEGSNEIPRGQDIPPGPALSPQDAIARMKLPPGFKVEVVASEPVVVNPTAFTFDDRGRIWVTESTEYPRASAGKGHDHVKILESTKNDGHYDKATIFKDGLNIPAGIAIGNGGVYVTNSPDVLFLQDTKRDGKADKQQVILTGFGRDDRHELPNSLTWGPDGWLYGMNGVFNHSHVVSPGDGKVYDFTCGIWRYNPKTKIFELFAEGTSNPWGLDYNRQGDWFVSCCVIDHLFHMTQSGYYQRQGGPYPPQTHPLPSITTEKHQLAAYGGLCIYDADVYPEEYRGTLFMGNLHGSCINRDTLTRNGSTYVQHNAPDFISANDAWYMPVSEKVGPDGCIYVMDWYDKYHCYQDANRDPPGLDRTRGRLYRVTYNDTPIFKPFDLQKASTDELIKLLDSPNVWWRREAQRILIEKFDPSMKSTLEAMALAPSKNNGHMHALWVLISAGAIDDSFEEKLLASEDEPTRNWGARAVGQARKVSPEIFEKLSPLANDPSPDVRAQLAVTAGRLDESHAVALLQTLLANPQNASDPLLPTLIYNNYRPFALAHADAAMSFFKSHPDIARPWSKSTAAWLRRAINATGRNPNEIVADLAETLSGKISKTDAYQAMQETYDAINQSTLKHSERAALFDEALRARIMEYASTPKGSVRVPAMALALLWDDPTAAQLARRYVSLDANQAVNRAMLLKALGEAGDAKENIPAFAALVKDNKAPILIRQTAVDALGSMNDPKAAQVLTSLYATMPADLRPMAINALTHSVAGGNALMAAVEAKTISPNDITANHARQLMGLNDKSLAAKVRATWGEVKTERNPERVKVVNDMRKLIRTKPPGNAAAGMAVFNKICAQCHTIYGHGGNVGPDLTGVGRENLDAILTNVLDPSLVIGAPYLVYDVHKKDGDMVSGILVEKSDKQIVVKDQTKQTVIPMSEVKKISTENISMMPEGLEKTMSEQEFIDLVAFLLQHEPPKLTP